MNGIVRLGALVVVVGSLVQSVGWGVVAASPAIRNEPGDPYNRPPRLPKPNMICVVGVESTSLLDVAAPRVFGPVTPRLVCPARLAPPLTSCRCYGSEEVGVRYFVLQSRALPTIFSFDGFAW